MAIVTQLRLAFAPMRRQGFARTARRRMPPLTATGAPAWLATRHSLTRMLRSLTTGSNTEFLTAPSETAASVIVAEIGVDMQRFPTVAHLISWAGLCPGLNQSAGKVKSRTLRDGAPWLKTMLVQSAWAASRNKDGYLRAQFLRIKSRRGPQKAIMAVAASILTAAYHLVRDPVPYRELGPVYLLRLDHERPVARLTQRLRTLGYEVEIREAAA